MSITLTMHLICKVGSISLLSLCYLVNRGRELWFGIINWVDNVNWPPLSVSKLTFGALALRQSEWRRANARNFSLETLYGDQLHHQLSWYCRITLLFLPPTQHHSLVRNPLYSSEIGSSPGHVDKHFFSSFYYLSPFTPTMLDKLKKQLISANFTQTSRRNIVFSSSCQIVSSASALQAVCRTDLFSTRIYLPLNFSHSLRGVWHYSFSSILLLCFRWTLGVRGEPVVKSVLLDLNKGRGL